jgi:hypothetical protein
MVLAVALTFTSHGAASAASGRIKAPAIGMNAPIVKVGAKNGSLAIGKNVHTVYTWKHSDPPCDPTGTTVYAGHAWKDGDGVADKWGSLTRGRIIKVNDCRFKVTKRRYWSAKRSIGHLYRVDGPPRIVLIGCKPDDYSKRTMVFARLLK